MDFFEKKGFLLFFWLIGSDCYEGQSKQKKAVQSYQIRFLEWCCKED